MAQAASIAQYVEIGFSKQQEAYGAWYEGEQQKNYYKTQNILNSNAKTMDVEGTNAAISRDIRLATSVKKEADNAYLEAEYTKQVGELTENKHQDETDSVVADAYAKMARSGVAMDFGSPVELLHAVADARAESFGMQKWKNQVDYWGAQRQAAGLKDKSSIMLDAARMEGWKLENRIELYNYQDTLNKMAIKEADRAAEIKEATAYISAVTDSLNVFLDGGGGSMGGMGGGGGAGAGGGG